MASRTKGPPKSRRRGFRAYPLIAEPPGWRIDPKTLAEATSVKRIGQNIVRGTRGGHETAQVALSSGVEGPYVVLLLAKLTNDAIERINTETGVSDLIEARPGEFFSESVQFVLNTSNGLAIGEYRPYSVSVLTKSPGTLLTQALLKLGSPEAMSSQPVGFKPFITKDFLERAVGRRVKKIHLSMAPPGPEFADQAGVRSPVVEEISLGANIATFDLSLGLTPTGPLSKGATNRIQSAAERLALLGANELLITMEDSEAFDLLSENWISYALGIDVLPGSKPEVIREKVRTELFTTLKSRERELLRILGRGD